MYINQTPGERADKEVTPREGYKSLVLAICVRPNGKERAQALNEEPIQILHSSWVLCKGF
jgi:hypothetical protein